METNKKVVAIVPARGGSKGLPDKNLRPFLGTPLLGHTIQAARASRRVSEVIISTDSQEIYNCAQAFGAKPFPLRPSELASDTALVIDTYLHVLDELSQAGLEPDAFIVLQPTSPLRTPDDIDNAVDLFLGNKADSVVSYTQELHPISWNRYIGKDGKLESILDDSNKNRQTYQPSYFPNGAIYVFKTSLIRNRKYYSDKSYAYVMPRERSVDIDTIEDFEYAEFLASRFS